jgi:hypothetical protein
VSGTVDLFDVARVSLWLLAGLVSLYFSVGNARIWTSISTGFFLVFISEAYLIAPWTQHGVVMAMHSVVGTIAALVITYGFMEYYVFSRTLESTGQKWAVYATTAFVLVASLLFMLVNVVPGPETVRNVRIVENTVWVAMSLINLDLQRKIYTQVRETPIARGFLGFMVVFALVFLWRGSMLYLQVWGFDPDAVAPGQVAAGLDARDYPFRVGLSNAVNHGASVLSSLSVGAVFIFLARSLR